MNDDSTYSIPGNFIHAKNKCSFCPKNSNILFIQYSRSLPLLAITCIILNYNLTEYQDFWTSVFQYLRELILSFQTSSDSVFIGHKKRHRWTNLGVIICKTSQVSRIIQYTNQKLFLRSLFLSTHFNVVIVLSQ